MSDGTLIIDRRVGQEILIGDDVRIMLTAIECDHPDEPRALLGVTAPRRKTVLRSELIERGQHGD